MSTEISARNPSFGVYLYRNDGLRADVYSILSRSRCANPSYEFSVSNMVQCFERGVNVVSAFEMHLHFSKLALLLMSVI
jgi:hypothetical protein